jgi:quinolinate synthase
MAMNALQNLEQVLVTGEQEVHIEPGIREHAVAPIERMLEFARDQGIGSARRA